MEDYLPRNWDEFAAWMQNFAEQLPKFSAKYGISAATLTAVAADAAWVSYWAQAKTNAKQQEKQLTDYADAIAKNEIGSPSPSEPTWELPPNPPAPVAPGVRKRIRQIAQFIKNNPAYEEADGELLGIVGAEAGEPDDLTPIFDLRSLPDFNVEAEFQKKGMDAARFEYRRANTDAWQQAVTLTSSPGSFRVPPQVAGRAEQIEVRCIYLRKNNPFGNYSDIKPAFIAP